jgi:acyl-CoA reductase-like NAD-dependent aldehyde dehydrogenase
MIDETAVKAYERAIQKKRRSESLFREGTSISDRLRKGTYVRPAIIEAHKDMSIVQEETIAPYYIS